MPSTWDVVASGTNVAVSPNGSQPVASGETETFTVTAATGYVRSDTVGGSCPAGSWSGDSYTTG